MSRNQKFLPGNSGALSEMMNRLKLIFRLMGDRRVNLLAKLIPLAGFAYLLMPVDLAPNAVLPVVGVLDDAAILWLTSYAFVEFCPPAVVQEHMAELGDNDPEGGASASDNSNIVDGESRDL